MMTETRHAPRRTRWAIPVTGAVIGVAYLVAGRSLPAYVLVFTLLSSWIGSGSLLGGAENAYKHGFAALWQAGGATENEPVGQFDGPLLSPLGERADPDRRPRVLHRRRAQHTVLAVTVPCLRPYPSEGGDLVAEAGHAMLQRRPEDLVVVRPAAQRHAERSITAACLATRTSLRFGSGRVVVARRMRWVTAAAAASEVRGSHMS